MNINITKELKELDKQIASSLKKKTKKPKKHISYTEMMIMKHIIVTEGPVYQKDIVAVTGLKKSSIAEQLDRMEEKKLIKRVEDKNDKRKNQIVLTKKVLDKKEEIQKALQEINKNLVKGITKKDLETFMKVLNKMKGNIK